VLSVNIGLPRVIGMQNGEAVSSGIAKQPVNLPRVSVGPVGIQGDGQADLRVHGGPDKAVYAYPSEHWPWWESEHALSCKPATFGENLTLSGGDERVVAIGDRFRWGQSILEVSQPRAPCYKFAMHVARQDAPLIMTKSARCGFYLRVLEAGEAPAQDAVLERLATSGGPSVHDAFTAALHPRVDRDLRLRVHDAPQLAAAWRTAVARQIA